MNARWVGWLSGAAVFAAIAPCAAAQTLEEALAAARDNNPSLQEAALGVRSAGESRWQARAEYLPSVELTYSVGESTTETETGIFTTEEDLSPESTNLRVTQDLYTGGRRRAQSSLARATVASARHTLDLTEQSVMLDVVSAYAGVRRDQAILGIRETYLQGLVDQVNGARRRLDVGEITFTDFALTEARMAGAIALLATARADLEASRARFTQVTGLIPTSLTRPPLPEGLPLTLDEALAQGERAHPALLRSREAENAARARVGIERSALRPRISVVGQASRREEASAPDQIERGDSAVAQLSVPLFEGGYGRSRVRQSRFDLNRAVATSEETRREVVALVVERWNGAISSREVLRAAVRRSSANAQAVEGAERELGMGLRSTLDVLNTREEWQQAQAEEARAEGDELIAAYALLAAVGALGFGDEER